MNPYALIITILGISVMVDHLTGQYYPEIAGLFALVLFFREHAAYRYVKSAEPEWMVGETEKIFFDPRNLRSRSKTWVGIIFGLICVISTLINTFGILK